MLIEARSWLPKVVAGDALQASVSAKSLAVRSVDCGYGVRSYPVEPKRERKTA